MRNGWKLLVLLLMAGLAAPVLAQEGTGDAEGGDETGDEASDADANVSESTEGEEDEEPAKSWSVGLSGSLSAGIGSFVSNEFVRRTRVRYGINLSGSYTIPVIDVGVSLSTGFSQWLSEAGGSQTVQEFRWGDIGLSFSRSIYTIPVADISISGSLGFTIPTSTYSRTAGLYTSISPGLSFGRSFGPINLGYSVGFGWDAYEATSVLYDPSEIDILSRDSGNEVLAADRIAEGGILPEWSVYNSFSISYSFLEQFSLSLGLTISDAWGHDNGTISQRDEFTPTVRDTDGNLVADVGRGHSQGSSGRLSFRYSPLDFLSLSLTVSSSQPWKTADNKGFRFPFFDFESPSNNFSSLSFGVSGNY